MPSYSFFAADTLLYVVILTLIFDLEHLQSIACDVIKLCTKFQRNRAIRGGVIAISIFDDLERVSHIALGFGIIFTRFESN